MTPKCPDCKRDQDDCVCVDPQERIDELERENKRLSDDHYFQACLTRDLMPYQERAIKAEQKCDALQADNARLREAMEEIGDTACGEASHQYIALTAFASTHEKSLAEYRNKVIEAFVNEFSRHVGGDGEFWLHELQDFAMKEQP